MSMYTSSTDVSGVLPPDFGQLVVQPVQRMSVAMQVADVVSTTAHDFHIPVVNADPSAAFVAEGDEISPSDATLSELTVTPSKCAGLTVVSAELAEDSSPAAQEIVGRGLARDIAKRVDESFFGSVAAPAPSGLGSLAGMTTVDAGTAFTNLDAFAESLSNADVLGVGIRAFVANPADALTLSQLKDEDGSNRPLLGVDASMPTRRTILGVPMVPSEYVPQGTVYGMPTDGRVLVVMRQDVSVEVDRSVFFTSHRVAIRAILRVGYGYPHPAAIQQINVTSGT